MENIMRFHPEVRLTGDRNECPGCGELFNSTSAFDRHRLGKHGIKEGPERRRCMSIEEIVARGMSKNAAGFWITEPFSRDIAAERRK
jgi:uncharacterized C2H2 Zn-finger protein